MKKIIFFFILINFISAAKAEVTYLEILKNPTDLKLNLRYAKEQEALGEFKSVIATLERLTALYPTNIDLKLYLLSISVKTDSTEKVSRLINEIRQSDEITDEIKNRVAQVFDDINKKKVDKEKTAARQKARDVVNEAEKQKTQNAEAPSTKWIFYQDLGWRTALHSNVGSISNSKTKYSSGTIVDMTGTEGDNIETINTLTGAIYQINETSNIAMTLGTSSSEQNRATSDENDTNSYSASYSKSTDKNSFSGSLSLTDTNTRRAADTISRNLNLSNTYSITDNQQLSTGITLADSSGNQNSANATKREANTFKQGANVGYRYTFGAQHSLNFKYAFNETDAIADYNGLTDETYTLSYSKNFAIGSLGLSYSITNKEYDQVDTFVHPTIIRNDDVENYSVSLNGSLGQISRSTELFKLPENLENYLNTLSYSLSWSETNNNSNLLQNDYEKETFNFGLTKRVYF